MSKIRFSGKGPGIQTVDGCSVDFYLKLKAGDTPDIIAKQISNGAEILELGCGVGRITHALINMGFEITAVDNSSDMLKHVKGAELICSDIEALRLEKKFDAVVLGSYLINSPEEASRLALLDTCQRHLKEGGVLLIEAHPYSTLNSISSGDKGENDGVHTYVNVLRRDAESLHLEIQWVVEGQKWSQSFLTEILDETRIRRLLGKSNLRFDQWIDESDSWFIAGIEEKSQ